jgi:hypothetical protein
MPTQSPAGTSVPWPSRTSGIAPLEVVTMSSPAAIASAKTRPNCSSQKARGRSNGCSGAVAEDSLPSSSAEAAAKTAGISS